MQKRKTVIAGIIGGLLGFAVHFLKDHYFSGVDLFSIGHHAINGTVFTFIGVEIGIIIGAMASRKSRKQN